MSKITINGNHLDLDAIVMIGSLKREGAKFLFPVMWRETGITSNVTAHETKEAYSLEPEKDAADKAESEYRRFVTEWAESGSAMKSLYGRR